MLEDDIADNKAPEDHDMKTPPLVLTINQSITGGVGSREELIVEMRYATGVRWVEVAYDAIAGKRVVGPK